MPTINHKDYWRVLTTHCWEMKGDNDAEAKDREYADAILHTLAELGFPVFDYKHKVVVTALDIADPDPKAN